MYEVGGRSEKPAHRRDKLWIISGPFAVFHRGGRGGAAGWRHHDRTPSHLTPATNGELYRPRALAPCRRHLSELHIAVCALKRLPECSVGAEWARAVANDRLIKQLGSSPPKTGGAVKMRGSLLWLSRQSADSETCSVRPPSTAWVLLVAGVVESTIPPQHEPGSTSDPRLLERERRQAVQPDRPSHPPRRLTATFLDGSHPASIHRSFQFY